MSLSLCYQHAQVLALVFTAQISQCSCRQNTRGEMPGMMTPWSLPKSTQVLAPLFWRGKFFWEE